MAEGETAPAIRSLTPALVVRDARAAAAFYRAAFGAVRGLTVEEPDGRIGHITMRIGSAVFFLADEHPERENVVAPDRLGGSAVTLDLEVDEVEPVLDRAVAAGATLVRPPMELHAGVWAGKVRDPFGHAWLITHLLTATAPGDAGGDAATEG